MTKLQYRSVRSNSLPPSFISKQSACLFHPSTCRLFTVFSEYNVSSHDRQAHKKTNSVLSQRRDYILYWALLHRCLKIVQTFNVVCPARDESERRKGNNKSSKNISSQTEKEHHSVAALKLLCTASWHYQMGDCAGQLGSHSTSSLC